MKRARIHQALSAIVVLGICAWAPAQADPSDYTQQVQTALPPIDPQIVQMQDGPDWLASVDYLLVAEAVQDMSGWDDVVSSPEYTVARDIARTKVIKIDRVRGRIRYASRLRAFDWSTSPHEAVTEAAAETLVMSAVGTLSVPFLEHGQLFVDTVIGLGIQEGGSIEYEHQRERLVTLLREVNGFPVFDSMLRSAISNEEEHARLLVRWPRFLPADHAGLRLRVNVVEDIANRIDQAMHGAAVDLDIELGYAPGGEHYVPVARVGFSEIEGSAEAVTGHLLMVELVDMPPDRDLDGVPDGADNCPDRPNPQQQDADLDTVGDACDNCPHWPNPGQEDADGDGIGDVCVEVEGACCTSSYDQSCDIATASECLSVGGTYLGDGLTCLGDGDHDAVGDACDNCPWGYNPDQGVSVFADPIRGRPYCETDPALACHWDGDCPTGDCIRGLFEWPLNAWVAHIIGDFVGSVDIGLYSWFSFGFASGTYFVHPDDPPPGSGFWYLVKADCPGFDSWQTVLGAEPLRDVVLP